MRNLPTIAGHTFDEVAMWGAVIKVQIDWAGVLSWHVEAKTARNGLTKNLWTGHTN